MRVPVDDFDIADGELQRFQVWHQAKKFNPVVSVKLESGVKTMYIQFHFCDAFAVDLQQVLDDLDL